MELRICVAVIIHYQLVKGRKPFFSFSEVYVPFTASWCSNASKELPSCIDYMLRETFNWFHKSPLLKEAHLELSKLIND